MFGVSQRLGQLDRSGGSDGGRRHFVLRCGALGPCAGAESPGGTVAGLRTFAVPLASSVPPSFCLTLSFYSCLL